VTSACYDKATGLYLSATVFTTEEPVVAK